MPAIIERAAIWKRLAAFYVDFCTVYYGGGYLIDLAVGEPSKHGGYFHGIIALAHLAVVVLYFIVGWLYAGGTLWDRIFRIPRPQPGDVEIPINTLDQVAVRAGFGDGCSLDRSTASSYRCCSSSWSLLCLSRHPAVSKCMVTSLTRPALKSKPYQTD